MSNSSLISCTYWSPYNSGQRNHKIDSVAIHCMAGPMSAAGCGSWFQSSQCRASSNYGIGGDGQIGLYVDEGDRSWCTSSSGVDNRAITIEVSSSYSAPFSVTDSAYKSLINLLIDICQRNGINGLRWQDSWSESQRYNYAHAAADSGGPVDQQNMFAHKWFANKDCPGSYLYSRFGQIAQEVNSKLGANISLSALSTPMTMVFIGDSRTVGMKSAVQDSDSSWSAKVSSGLAWMKSTGVTQIESKIKENTVVFILMGINDMTYVPASSYTSYINEKATQWKAKGAVTCFVSINPLGSSYVGTLSNTAIQKYNQEIRSGLSANVKYVDTYSQLIGSVKSTDGLHYTADTYKQLYAILKSVAESSITVTGVGSFQRIEIDYKKLKPYVITVSRSTPSLNFSALRDAGVIGGIYESGYLFNSWHMKEDTFRNPRLYDQLKLAVDAKFDFGYYMPARARTEEECKEEIYELSFIVRKYPPALGVWLILDFPQRVKTTNDRLLDCYYKELVRLGLKAKIGIYGTEQQLNKINWSKHQLKWFFWLNEHVKKLEDIDKLLDPTFFDMEGRYT